jgi:hypothetical protein
MKSPLESAVQKSILNYLSMLRNVTAWRNQSIGVYDAKKKIFRKPKGKFAINGVSDILGIINNNGIFLAIEVKRDKKAKASLDQTIFINMINESGGIAFVAYSVDCVENEFKRQEKLKSITIF